MPILEYNPAMKKIKHCPFCGSKDLTRIPMWWKCDKCHKEFRISENTRLAKPENNILW